MNVSGCVRVCRVIGIFAAALMLAASGKVFGQQITYYDFDAPLANGNFSYSCGNPAQGLVGTNPLFCFNDGTGKAQHPTFLFDSYPASVDPVTIGQPAISSHYAIQTTPPTFGQQQSMWFATPQKVSKGFTAYFAFKLTPSDQVYATADGIAFVIQNAAGGKAPDAASGCAEIGSGPSVVGGPGRCIGYGGIDNSLAIEFDTYRNSWDPDDIPSSHYNDNHVAVQSCGPGLPNTPDHDNHCNIPLVAGTGAAPVKAIATSPVVMADGAVHQVVVNYSGPEEAIPNLLQIYIDPPFEPGTHTPTPAAVPVLSGTTSELSSFLNLMTSDTGADSAYVGFTSSTGNAFENTEVLAWTFTPHTTVTLQEPLSAPGAITLFDFGNHVFGVTYPFGGPSTANIDMIVTANTVSPPLFDQLIAGSQFVGTQCQVYDGTGGNCIVYSVSCVVHGTNVPVQCPVTTDPTRPIIVKTSYDNTVQPLSPGFLQGDPLLSGISSIVGNGTTATITCMGECSSTAGEKILIVGATPANFDGPATVQTANSSTPNIITVASPVVGTASGGFLNSANIQNIFFSYASQRIDGTQTSKTKNFSDLVATSVTVSPSLVFSPSTARFGMVGVGTTSATIPVTVTNNTRAPAGYSGISAGLGDFNFQPGTCGAVATGTMLPAGASCTFYVSFSPTATGQMNGSFTLSTNDGPVTYRMAGTGVPAALVFSPASASFGNVGMGTTSQPITVTVQNYTGSTAAYIPGSAVGLAPFSFQAVTCKPPTSGMSITAGGACTFKVTLTPAALGPVAGRFAVSTSSGTVVFSLSGNGVPAVFSFTPPSIDFGYVGPDSTSSPVTVTAANNTGSKASYASSTGLGSFKFQLLSCGPDMTSMTLAANESCQFAVTFAPTSQAPSMGSITVNSSAGQVSLSLIGNYSE